MLTLYHAGETLFAAAFALSVWVIVRTLVLGWGRVLDALEGRL